MKFLAILRDSLREAIDTKVFYVMVGISLLLILLSFTFTFEPKPAGKELMTAATAPLTIDLSDLDPERLMHLQINASQDKYELVAVEPIGGAADAPASPFRVLIRGRFANPRDASEVRADPEKTLQLIRTKFGSIDRMQIVAVTEARLAQSDEPDMPAKTEPTDVYFTLTTQPTPTTYRLWPHSFGLFFGAFQPFGDAGAPLAAQLFLIEGYIVNGLGAWIAVLVSIVITAFFIPNMLRKGTVDMLLVKPVHRSTLLLFKFVGGLIFIFLNTAVAVGGVWLALSMRSGIWAFGFLLSILVITFFFALLYAVSTLVGVLTRSPIVSILLTCGLWAALFVVGLMYLFVESRSQQEERQNVPVAERVSENWFARGVNIVHFVLPRTKDLDYLMDRILMSDLLTNNQIKIQKLDRTRISWGESLTVNSLFLVLMLGLACWRFATRDY